MNNEKEKLQGDCRALETPVQDRMMSGPVENRATSPRPCPQAETEAEAEAETERGKQPDVLKRRPNSLSRSILPLVLIAAWGHAAYMACGATVTGRLGDIGLSGLKTKITFTPTNEVLVAPGFGLSTGPPTTIDSTNDGTFSVVLDAGDYVVKLPLVSWRSAFGISVPRTNGTLNITNLLSGPRTYIFTNPPTSQYVARVTSSNGSVTISGDGIGTVDLSASGISGTYITGLSNEFNILNSIASNAISACQFTYSGGAFSGTNSWKPGTGGEYDLFAVRDTVMTMRSAPWQFTDNDVRNICNQTASLYALNDTADIGVGITTSGTPITSRPQVDHSFELIDVLYEHFRRTGSTAAFTQWSTVASNTFTYQQVSNHLIFLNPDDDKVGFGFEDSIEVQGYNLMCSLYRYRACQELHYLTTAAGHVTTFYTNEMPFIRTNLETQLYDASRHLFRAASLSDVGAPITFHHVMGSAYAVVLGAARSNVLDAVSIQLTALSDSGIFLNGAVRHILPEEDWSALNIFAPIQPRGEYQNGGFWPEFTHWVAIAVKRTNKKAANDLMRNLAGRYQALNEATATTAPLEYETVLGVEEHSHYSALQYLASAGMPLAYWSTNSFQR